MQCLITAPPVLSNECFRVKPDVLDRILLWCVWRTSHARHRPFFRRIPVIDCCTVLSHVNATMLRCTIPTHDHSRANVALPKLRNKDAGPVPIPSISKNCRDFARNWFTCSILRLPFTLIEHRNGHAVCAWPPHRAPSIIPQQMALIQVADADIAGNNCGFIRLHQRFYLFFLQHLLPVAALGWLPAFFIRDRCRCTQVILTLVGVKDHRIAVRDVLA